MSTLVVRADADASMGAGHLMRCLALADAWEAAGGRTVILADAGAAAAIPRVQGDGRRFVATSARHPDGRDAEQTVRVARLCGRGSCSETWVVADGYHFDEAFHRPVRDSGARLLVIDDTVRLQRYAADVVLNQNPGAESLDYTGVDDTQLLLGGRYAMLRSQIVTRRREDRQQPQVARRVLVTMGGADPHNFTERVIEALGRVRTPGLEVTIVVGPLNPRGADLESAARRSAVPMRVLASPSDFPTLMARADLAVTAAGSTTWELLCLGIPAVLIPVADHQRLGADAAGRAAAAEVMHHSGDFDVAALAHTVERLCGDRDRRRDLSAHARRFIDGRGISRVLACIGNGGSEPFARLRRATETDVEGIWNISNDPEVRRNAFNPSAIPFEHHVQWYSARLASADSVMWVLDARGEIAAQIRYDRSNDGAAVISFSVAAAWRNRGFGIRLLASTWRTSCAILDMDRARGVTFCDNHASVQAFQAAGFECVGSHVIEGHDCQIFERRAGLRENHAGAH